MVVGHIYSVLSCRAFLFNKFLVYIWLINYRDFISYDNVAFRKIIVRFVKMGYLIPVDPPNLVNFRAW